MKKVTWWFRIVGVWYLLLTVMNVYFYLADTSMLRDTLPFPADDFALRAFMDAWAVFVFEIFGIGTFMLWASRDPLKYISTVYLIIWLEFCHGVLDDLYLISQGYSATDYIAFIVIHVIIIATGWLFARQASATLESAAKV